MNNETHKTIRVFATMETDLEAMREFTELVGADCDVEVIDIEQVEEIES